MDKNIKPIESSEKNQSFSKAKSLIILITVVVLVASIVAAILYKYISGTLVLNLNMVELISLVLAIFSIGISIAFYFKASETSDRFYIHSYEYMKEQSILLGRIEERFGEKLGDIQTTVARLVSDKAAVVAGKQEEIDQGIENDKEKFLQSEEYKKLTEERDYALKELNSVTKQLNNVLSMNNQNNNEISNSLSKKTTAYIESLLDNIPIQSIHKSKIEIETITKGTRDKLNILGVIDNFGNVHPLYQEIVWNYKLRGSIV